MLPRSTIITFSAVAYETGFCTSGAEPQAIRNATGGEPALVADSFEGRGQVRGLEALVFDGYNE